MVLYIEDKIVFTPFALSGSSFLIRILGLVPLVSNVAQQSMLLFPKAIRPSE